VTYAEINQIIQGFKGLYSGGVAQMLRDSGAPDHLAMPPWTKTRWLGKNVIKCPMDLWVYQEIIFETQPDVLLETGTSIGGSAFYFATLFDLLGRGRVVTVDKDEYRNHWVNHPRITYLVGDSVSDAVLGQMGKAASGKVLVSLDSLHTRKHVAKELAAYSQFVSVDGFLVVEDVAVDFDTPLSAQVASDSGGGACAEFMTRHPEFVRDTIGEVHLMTSNVWLRRER